MRVLPVHDRDVSLREKRVFDPVFIAIKQTDQSRAVSEHFEFVLVHRVARVPNDGDTNARRELPDSGCRQSLCAHIVSIDLSLRHHDLLDIGSALHIFAVHGQSALHVQAYTA